MKAYYIEDKYLDYFEEFIKERVVVEITPTFTFPDGVTIDYYALFVAVTTRRIVWQCKVG